MINGRKVAAVVCLHFGVEYLAYAMRSVADVVDEFYIMYSPVPNHGVFDTAHPCPETRDELIEAAFATAPERTRWFDYSQWRTEGEQFKSAWQHTDAPVIVKLDADEIWTPGLLADAVNYGIQQRAAEIRLPLRHYWRSFQRAFTQDPAAPGRIYLRDFAGNAVTFDTPDNDYRIHHFGYAQGVAITRYKMGIHGHKHQFRHDCDWLNDVFLANRQTDCHPVGSEYWNVETVEPLVFLSDHPYYALEIIE